MLSVYESPLTIFRPFDEPSRGVVDNSKVTSYNVASRGNLHRKMFKKKRRKIR
jgi:hypothetical protein